MAKQCQLPNHHSTFHEQRRPLGLWLSPHLFHHHIHKDQGALDILEAHLIAHNKSPSNIICWIFADEELHKGRFSKLTFLPHLSKQKPARLENEKISKTRLILMQTGSRPDYFFRHPKTILGSIRAKGYNPPSKLQLDDCKLSYILTKKSYFMFCIIDILHNLKKKLNLSEDSANDDYEWRNIIHVADPNIAETRL